MGALLLTLATLALISGAELAAQASPNQASVQRTRMATESTVLGHNDGLPALCHKTAVGSLSVAVETAVFFKNLELSSRGGQSILSGETFFGFLAPLRLHYQAHDSVSVELGALFGHNYGRDDALDIAAPLARIIYTPWANSSVIAGTLLPTHAIHEALLDDVHQFEDVPEQGLQVRHASDQLSHDSWLSWRVAERADRREELDFGSVTSWRSGGIEIDAQWLWAHTGGQNNSIPGVRNNLTATAGATVWLPLAGEHALAAGGRILWSRDERTGQRRFDGVGHEFRLGCDLHGDGSLLRLTAAHYLGQALVAERGDLLYHLDDYTAVSADYRRKLSQGLQLRLAANLQFADHRTHYTIDLSFVFGECFELGNLRQPGGGRR